MACDRASPYAGTTAAGFNPWTATEEGLGPHRLAGWRPGGDAPTGCNGLDDHQTAPACAHRRRGVHAAPDGGACWPRRMRFVRGPGCIHDVAAAADRLGSYGDGAKLLSWSCPVRGRGPMSASQKPADSRWKSDAMPTLWRLGGVRTQKEKPNAKRPSPSFHWTEGPSGTFCEVPPAGFEPAHTAPEAVALSPELRGRCRLCSRGDG